MSLIQFEKAVHALCDAEAEFVVIGDVSAILHGSALVTFDLDVCYLRSSANLKRLVAALLPFHPRPQGFPHGLPFIWDEAMLRSLAVLTLQTDLSEIDFRQKFTSLLSQK